MASLKAEVTLAQLHTSTSSTSTSVSYVSFLVLCIVHFSHLICCFLVMWGSDPTTLPYVMHVISMTAAALALIMTNPLILSSLH